MNASDAETLVRRYLADMERRDLDAARTALAAGFVMTFPGGARFETLEALVAWARPRYRFVRKAYDRFDVVEGEPAVVYAYGTLAGEWPDGAPFAGIRFIDRFTVSHGRLVDQMVWNDLAEVRGAA